MPLAAVASAGTVVSAQRDLDQELVLQVNAVRGGHGLRPLRPSQGLASAAGAHSLEMARLGFFSHASANGSSLRERIGRFYCSPPCRSWTAGENLFWGSPSTTARDAVRLWMRSAAHRANLLSPRWREIGVSSLRAEAAPGFFRGRTVTIVTVDFGARRAAAHG